MKFFEGLLRELQAQDTSLVVVSHAVPGTDEFIHEVHKNFRVACFIPKPNSIDSNTPHRIATTVPILNYTRDLICENRAEFFEDLGCLTRRERFVVIDTGGYFCPIIAELKSAMGDRFLGLVEDTENGHLRYASLLLECPDAGFPCPIVSAARSPLKAPEDYLVGQAIAFSADALLRECGEIMAGKAACVLGYGRIGSSVATNLRQRGALVTVIDIDPARQALALAHGYRLPKRSDHLREYHLIFGATGCRSLCRSNIHSFRDGCYIFTATSGDDEIDDYEALQNDYANTRHPKIVAFGQKRKVLICNNGNSANFMHGGVVGPFIKLVQAELVLAAASVEKFGRDRIFELDEGARSLIAQRWMEVYAHQ